MFTNMAELVEARTWRLTLLKPRINESTDAIWRRPVEDDG